MQVFHLLEVLLPERHLPVVVLVVQDLELFLVLLLQVSQLRQLHRRRQFVQEDRKSTRLNSSH